MNTMKTCSLLLGLGMCVLPVPSFAVALTLEVGSALASSVAKESAFPLSVLSGTMGGPDLFTSSNT